MTEDASFEKFLIKIKLIKEGSITFCKTLICVNLLTTVIFLLKDMYWRKDNYLHKKINKICEIQSFETYKTFIIYILCQCSLLNSHFH